MVKEANLNIDLIQHPFAKPCMMTIFMHDYATPPPTKTEIFPFVHSEKSEKPVAIEIFLNATMEYVRDCNDEQLGRLIRMALNNLDKKKSEIEKKKI